MGTPDFALFSLKKLHESGHEIAAVVTQPDKPTGRGYVMTPPIVKRWALENGLTVYQPTTLKDEAFAELLRTVDPELIVVVAFGKIRLYQRSRLAPPRIQRRRAHAEGYNRRQEGDRRHYYVYGRWT